MQGESNLQQSLARQVRAVKTLIFAIVMLIGGLFYLGYQWSQERIGHVYALEHFQAKARAYDHFVAMVNECACGHNFKVLVPKDQCQCGREADGTVLKNVIMQSRQFGIVLFQANGGYTDNFSPPTDMYEPY